MGAGALKVLSRGGQGCWALKGLIREVPEDLRIIVENRRDRNTLLFNFGTEKSCFTDFYN